MAATDVKEEFGFNEMESEIRKEEKKLQIGSYISIFVICVLIGIPLWWKTTEVYRFGLPYSTIDQQNSINELPMLIQLEVVVPKSVPDHQQLTTQLNNHLLNIFENEDFPEDHQDQPHMGVKKEVKVRVATEKEELVVRVATDLKELDNGLRRSKTSSPGTLSFFILSPHSIRADDDDDDDGVVMGLDRVVYVRLDGGVEMAKRINYVLENFYIRRSVLSSALQGCKPNNKNQLDKTSMTSLPPTPSIDLIFTLVHPGRVNVQWDIQDGVKEYLDPMLNDLKPYANFSVRSQLIHLLTFPSKFSRSCQCHPLPWKSLPHVINPIEPYLASHVTDNPILNFVTYIPTMDQTPLILFHQSGEASTTNSFLVPRWGGILVKNTPSTPQNSEKPTPQNSEKPTPQNSENPTKNLENPAPLSVTINSKELLAVFIAQMKSLIGFEKPSYYQIKGFKALTSPKKIIPNWELDSWLLHRTVDNIATSTTTMSSLKQLLTLINNIIINDDVGNQVYTSVQHTAISLLSLSTGQLHTAHLHSLQALQSSEKAFFDHSLLELLYFPEDQKFAIYLPLFFPLGLPILASFVQTFRYFKNVYKQNQTK